MCCVCKCTTAKVQQYVFCVGGQLQPAYTSLLVAVLEPMKAWMASDNHGMLGCASGEHPIGNFMALLVVQRQEQPHVQPPAVCETAQVLVSCQAPDLDQGYFWHGGADEFPVFCNFIVFLCPMPSPWHAVQHHVMI